MALHGDAPIADRRVTWKACVTPITALQRSAYEIQVTVIVPDPFAHKSRYQPTAVTHQPISRKSFSAMQIAS